MLIDMEPLDGIVVCSCCQELSPTMALYLIDGDGKHARGICAECVDEVEAFIAKQGTDQYQKGYDDGRESMSTIDDE